MLVLAASCPICREGAKKVQAEVLDKIKSDRLRIFVVWLPVFQSCNRAWAVDSADIITDKRAVQFWNPDKSIGLQFGKVLKLPEKGEKGAPLAWDVYLLFDGNSSWKSTAPTPGTWMWRHPIGRKDGRLDTAVLREKIEEQLRSAKP